MPFDAVGARVVVGDLLALAVAVHGLFVEVRVVDHAEVLRPELHDGVGAARIAVLEGLGGIITRRFVDRESVVAEERAQKVPRRADRRAGRGPRQPREFGRAGLSVEVLPFRAVGEDLRTRDHEDAFGRVLGRLQEEFPEILVQPVDAQLHAFRGGVSGCSEESFGLLDIAQTVGVPFADGGEVERRAGLHAVGCSLRGALNLRSGILPGQHVDHGVELRENIFEHLPAVLPFEQIGGVASGFGFDVDILVDDHHVAEVHQQPGIEAGAVEAGVPFDPVVGVGIHRGFEFAEFGDDLVAAVDARIGDIPHARHDGIRTVEVSVVERDGRRAVGEVIGEGIQFALVGGVPLVPFLGPELVEQNGVEVHLELFGCLEPVSGCGLVPGREVEIAASEECGAAERED